MLIYILAKFAKIENIKKILKYASKSQNIFYRKNVILVLQTINLIKLLQQFTSFIIEYLLFIEIRNTMQSRCRVSTRRNIRQSAPCQEINNIFNIFKHEVQNTIQIDNSLLKKLPTTHKITCQMIQNMPQSQIPSKQNQQKCLLNMKKMIDFQESLFNKQLEKHESHNQIITPQDLLEMEQQNDECFKEMRKKLMQKTVENKDRKTKDIEEIQIEEDAIYMSDKIRRQLDDYLTIN